jgi:hypothetical protein
MQTTSKVDEPVELHGRRDPPQRIGRQDLDAENEDQSIRARYRPRGVPFANARRASICYSRVILTVRPSDTR